MSSGTLELTPDRKVNRELTPGGKVYQSLLPMICKWVKQSWALIMRKTFCGNRATASRAKQRIQTTNQIQTTQTLSKH
ncbi:hypothetical protein PR048_033147, partial [Dryococelus australis]